MAAVAAQNPCKGTSRFPNTSVNSFVGSAGVVRRARGQGQPLSRIYSCQSRAGLLSKQCRFIIITDKRIQGKQ